MDRISNADIQGEEEELPEDFFDDFNDSFIECLNANDDSNEEKPRILEDELRDLLRSRKEESARGSSKSHTSNRRNLDKTNRDIKKDKEAKVKEHISRRLNSASGPPGTELDDFIKDAKLKSHRRSPSPAKRRRSPERRRAQLHHSPHRNSPPRRSPHRRLPPRLSHHISPHRRSSSRSRRWSRSCSRSRRWSRSCSRSPTGRLNKRKHRSPLTFQNSPSSQERRRLNSTPRLHHLARSPSRDRYNQVENTSSLPYPMPVYTHEMFPPQNPNQGYFPTPQVIPQQIMPLMDLNLCPQPVFYPEQNYSYASGVPGYYNHPETGMVPQMVPAPQPVPAPVVMMPDQLPPPPPSYSLPSSSVFKQTNDPLEQLLQDGKITREDYMKLKPKNREPAPTKSTKEKVQLLMHCNDAATKLGKLHLPNQVKVTRSKSPEESVQTKFSSPLHRDPAVNFSFTSTSKANQANKQLVDSIVAAVELEENGAEPVKKESKYKNSSTQTSTPFCETCEIRQLTHSNEKGTSINADHFSTSVHTQVIEAELVKSKTMFTPVGTKSESATISMSHLTPAQLIVSQLAARAKKLEQQAENTENKYGRRPANANNSYYGHHGYQDNYRYSARRRTIPRDLVEQLTYSRSTSTKTCGPRSVISCKSGPYLAVDFVKALK